MGLVAKAFQDIITFSRASSGTYVNSSGYITNSSVLNYLTYSNQPENAAWTKSNSFVQENLLRYSQEIDNAAAWSNGIAGTGVASTVTANQGIAPDGTLTADRVQFNLGGGLTTGDYTRRLQSYVTSAVVHTFSIYLRSFDGSSSYDMHIVGPTGAQTNIVVTGTWQRFTVTATGSGISIAYAVGLRGGQVPANSNTADVLVYGAQLVQGSVPGDYRATTSAALPCLYADYNGALRARKLCENDAVTQAHRIQQTVNLSGTSITLSQKIKAGERTWAYLRIDDASFSKFAYFNLSAGTVGFATAGLTSTITNAGSGWYVCTVTYAAPVATASGVWVVGVATGDSVNAYTGDGSSGIYIADAQLNDGSSALAYYNTDASAYNAPRFDYDPVTLAAKGLLVEEQRANLLTYSNDWSNAVWNKGTNITLTAAATLGPDGNVSATKLQATASATTIVNQSFTSTATSHTYSVYAKQGSGATDANTFAVNNNTTATLLALLTINYSTGVVTQTIGTGATATSAGNGYWRIQIPVTSGITIGNILQVYTGFTGNVETAGEFLYAFGAQAEAGAFATSVIPTVASQVTRAADVASVNTLSPWYNSVAGTLYAEYDTTVLRVGSTTVYNVVSADAGNSNNQIALYNYSNFAGGRVVVSGSTQADINGGGSPTNDATIKSGIAYAVNNVAVTANGAAPGTDASVTLPTVDRLSLGQVASTGFLNGHLRRITYYPRRLTNAELQTLTTL